VDAHLAKGRRVHRELLSLSPGSAARVRAGVLAQPRGYKPPAAAPTAPARRAEQNAFFYGGDDNATAMTNGG
jgi:hypothetical protein